MKNYLTEREGQMAFFDDFKIDYINNPVLVDNTDGIWNGNILEFKLNISDLNKVLFQTIKYLSKMRNKGESVPANIVLVSLNNRKAYLYHSQDYFNEIHTQYIGAASVNNSGFTSKSPVDSFDYTDQVDIVRLKTVLKQNNFMEIELDENCICGWAERYYRELPTARKGDFLGVGNGKVNIVGEIRDPKHFKGLIKPYTGATNEKFKYLMDKLNDTLSKKKLGAFYTPDEYARKACDLVAKAIARVPEGNDYILLDRCAGSGNLEQAIVDILGDEVASHIVCSTFEYYEYKVLLDRVGDKVRTVIPPTESSINYENGFILNADATSKEYVDNMIIKGYIDNPNCTIIGMENPPYSDEASGLSKGKREIKEKKISYMVSEMKKEVKGVATNDLLNQFVWSMFKYYLRQDADSYIVFGPVKYWKQYDLFKGKFIDGFLFNRKHFHATESAIACVLWSNEKNNSKSIKLKTYDIDNSNLIYEGISTIKKVGAPASKYYSKIKFKEKELSTVWCAADGTEALGKTKHVKSYSNDEVIGYLTSVGYSPDIKHRYMTRLCLFNGHGCYLTKTNYLELLPIWVAKMIPIDNWYEKDVYATTFDGGDKYKKDNTFLNRCFIYTCLSNQNKCMSFKGSDGKDYQNELCFDDRTIASAYLEGIKFNKDEEELIKLWNKILKEAKKCANYDSQWNYGVYQISKDLNTSYKDEKDKTVYDYPELNGDLNSLRDKLKIYYNEYIREDMFKYELVK